MADLVRVAWCWAADHVPGNAWNETKAVGEKPANPWGLHDIHGNVWEWCQDSYEDYAPERVTDPCVQSTKLRPVLRGGSWSDGPRTLRSACRIWYAPEARGTTFGFRLVAQLAEE